MTRHERDVRQLVSDAQTHGDTSDGTRPSQWDFDISFIATQRRTMAIVYYVTNLRHQGVPAGEVEGEDVGIGPPPRTALAATELGSF